MSGTSNVGGAGVYEAKDQRTAPDDETNQPDRFHEGKEHSHKALDSKDERSIANKLAREGKRSQEDEPKSEETKLLQEDPTLPAKSHGNKPSRGAEIDAEIKAEEEEMLKKKDAKK